jgi:hypothetical protein
MRARPEEVVVAALVQRVEELGQVRDGVDEGQDLGRVDHLVLERDAVQVRHRRQHRVQDARLVAEQLRAAGMRMRQSHVMPPGFV